MPVWGCLAALHRGEGHDLVAFQANGVGGREVVGHEHHAFLDAVQGVGVGVVARLAQQLRLHAAGHQLHVLDAFADVGVLDGGKGAGDVVHGFFQRPFGGYGHAGHDLLGRAHELGIGADHEVGIDDGGLFLQVVRHLVQGLAQVGGCLREGGGKPFDLGGNGLGGDGLARDMLEPAAVDEKRLADGDAR